jgi:hypothetical protein
MEDRAIVASVMLSLLLHTVVFYTFHLMAVGLVVSSSTIISSSEQFFGYCLVRYPITFLLIQPASRNN